MSVKPEDLKLGMVLTVRYPGLRLVAVRVISVDHTRREFLSQIGPVPFTSLHMLDKEQVSDV